MLVSSGQNACAQITAASCLSRVVKAPVLKLRPFISLVLSVPRDKYLEGRLFLLNSSGNEFSYIIYSRAKNKSCN